MTDKLAQYDMVLSVSEDAINAQLEHLYKTEVPGQDIDAKPKKYLIDHNLVLSNEVDDSYLSGIIKSPTVSFKDLSQSANANRTVRLTFEFTDDEDNNFTWYKPVFEIVDGQRKPVFEIIDGKRRRVPPIEENVPISGWKFWLEAAIGRSDIQEVIEKAVHPDIKSTLTEYVNSEDFLVSSLFCAFESTQIASSFGIIDREGNVPSEGAMSSWVNTLAMHFSNMNKEPHKAGNPQYILGYAVTQKPKADAGTAFFAPAKFHMTTTPEGSKPTLNWNMLLSKDSTVNPKVDPSAGIFTKSFFTVVHSEQHDGILAMSENIIREKFIKELVIPKFRPRELPNFPTAFKLCGNLKGTNDPDDVSAGKYGIRHVWETDYASSDVGLFWLHSRFYGDWSVKTEWSSSCQKSPSEVSKPDSKRELYLIVKVDMHTHWQLQTSAKIRSDDWSEATDTDINVPIYLWYNVTPGKDGKWNITQNTSKSKIPSRDDQGRLKVWTNDDNSLITSLKNILSPPGEGIKIDLKTHGFAALGSALGINDFSGLTQSLGTMTGALADMQSFDTDTSQLSDLRNKILMPAGGVFSYTGLDTDSNGNVYSHVDYDTISGGDRINDPR